MWVHTAYLWTDYPSRESLSLRLLREEKGWSGPAFCNSSCWPLSGWPTEKAFTSSRTWRGQMTRSGTTEIRCDYANFCQRLNSYLFILVFLFGIENGVTSWEQPCISTKQGPDTWGKKFSSCRGDHQSPVNIQVTRINTGVRQGPLKVLKLSILWSPIFGIWVLL